MDALVDSPSGTESLLVEIKAVERFASIHTAQVVSYLRATGLPLGLLLNFNVPQMRMGVRRVILGEWFAGASNAACID
ncbi:hypothetical protein AKJ09_03612 [Labilithrix luteola]|uniref:GxxExxY protein n=1 Tax=Labilithrix luteola TaxID=1391654 RepID=A0A0K1PTS8_9BACT|nr:hypothetical protein AKJ09_03612 [Labilithrix luteola]